MVVLFWFLPLSELFCQVLKHSTARVPRTQTPLGDVDIDGLDDVNLLHSGAAGVLATKIFIHFPFFPLASIPSLLFLSVCLSLCLSVNFHPFYLEQSYVIYS